MKKGRGERIKNVPAVRASISFPPDLYETLEDIAKQKKVSLAWVVRDAAEKALFGALRLRTNSCWRRTRISASREQQAPTAARANIRTTCCAKVHGAEFPLT